MKKIPKKYQPKGFEILYEDRDIFVGNKAPGFLTVGAAWDRVNTIHYALNQYVRKGSAKSRKCVYVVHRLDQATSGILIFAKTEQVQLFLKDDWKSTIKTYYAIVHGKMARKSGTISSFLVEDEEYMMHSVEDNSGGKLSHTEYDVVKETEKFSLLKINLLTGRKNQIRVHLADEGHPVVGDDKYGREDRRFNFLALHSQSIEFTHPFKRERMKFEAKAPDYFRKLIDYAY
ncbi:MAG: RluA family pseudouridine synthase [Candidatus Omnitrophica bacterium]|nr:RluA family pseudouridine synthase [Candidatus Omnitrophota bacterium]